MPQPNTEVEQEIIILAKMGDPTQLSKASRYESRIQANIFTKEGNKFRIRKSVRSNNPPYFTLTTKRYTDSGGITKKCIERTTEISPDTFNNLILNTAEDITAYTRYFFPIETLTFQKDGNDVQISLKGKKIYWEVDVFQKEDDTNSEWVKIEVEVQDFIPILEENNIDINGTFETCLKMSNLPIKPKDIIVVSEKSNDPDRNALIDYIFQNEIQVKIRRK